MTKSETLKQLKDIVQSTQNLATYQNQSNSCKKVVDLIENSISMTERDLGLSKSKQ